METGKKFQRAPSPSSILWSFLRARGRKFSFVSSPLKCHVRVESFGFYLLKDFVSSRDGQERMEYLFDGFCGYPSVKCFLLPFLVIDFGWITVGMTMWGIFGRYNWQTTNLSGALICKIICSYMIIVFGGLLFSRLWWNIYPFTVHVTVI